jgi:hypothetical protein
MHPLLQERLTSKHSRKREPNQKVGTTLMTTR